MAGASLSCRRRREGQVAQTRSPHGIGQRCFFSGMGGSGWREGGMFETPVIIVEVPTRHTHIYILSIYYRLRAEVRWTARVGVTHTEGEQRERSIVSLI